MTAADGWSGVRPVTAAFTSLAHVDFRVTDGHVTAVWCRGSWCAVMFTDYMHIRVCGGVVRTSPGGSKSRETRPPCPGGSTPSRARRLWRGGNASEPHPARRRPSGHPSRRSWQRAASFVRERSGGGANSRSRSGAAASHTCTTGNCGGSSPPPPRQPPSSTAATFAIHGCTATRRSRTGSGSLSTAGRDPRTRRFCG